MLKNFVACFIVPALVVLMGAVLVALSSPGRQEGAPPPLAAGVKVMSIPAAAFRPEKGSTDYYNFIELTQDNGAAKYFDAPVVLPHGSRILRIGFSYYDAYFEDIVLKLKFYNDSVVISNPITVNSAGIESFYRKIISPVTPVYITTLSRGYILELRLPSGSFIYSFLRAFVYYRDAP